MTLASFIHRYEEHGGGDLPAFSWAWADAPPYARIGEVDTLDGFLLVLSPWAVRNIRFDESLGRLHGYDLDFCLQVREAGRKVMTADFRAIHHHSLELFSDPRSWIEAHIKGRREVGGRMPGIGTGAGHLEASARCGPRPSATPPARSRTRKALELRGARQRARARAGRDQREPLVAHHRARCGPAAAGARAARVAMIAFGAVDRRGRGLPPLRRAGHRARRRAGLGGATRSRPSGRSPAATTCCSTPPRAHDDLEALVLVHPHTEITDPDFCAKVSAALRDPEVAVVGSSGASGVRTIAWWEGEVSCGPVVHRYDEHGGGEMPALRLGRSRRAAAARWTPSTAS